MIGSIIQQVNAVMHTLANVCPVLSETKFGFPACYPNLNLRIGHHVYTSILLLRDTEP